MSLPIEWFTNAWKKGEKEPILGRVTINMSDEATKILGFPGAMISASKSGYDRAHPDNTVYFNACIWNKEKEEIWFGDLDITENTDRLVALANKVGKIYVTPEQPWRFYGWDKKRLTARDMERVLEFG